MQGSTGNRTVSRHAIVATALSAWLVAFAALTPLPAAAVAKPTGDAKAGEAVFQQRCFACHSVAPDEVRLGPSLFHELKKPKPKKTEPEVRLIIKNGKNKMPAWGAILTPEQTNDILAYLHTL